MREGSYNESVPRTQLLPLAAPILITSIAVISAALGVWMESLRSISRQMVPFGGGMLMGVALFWVLPEMAQALNWAVALLWIAAGAVLLGAIDRFVYPVCPACSHAHEHERCSTTLHGFAPPLLIAVGLHAALDGWSVSVADGEATLSRAFLVAVAVHKGSEGLALGVIVRAALESRKGALAWCMLAEVMTIVGALIEMAIAAQLSSYAIHALLAIAGGSFVYLGGHAIHGEWRRKGRTAAAFVPALTGIAGPSVLRLLRLM